MVACGSEGKGAALLDRLLKFRFAEKRWFLFFLREAKAKQPVYTAFNFSLKFSIYQGVPSESDGLLLDRSHR
jgi:hypothetical protein